MRRKDCDNPTHHATPRRIGMWLAVLTLAAGAAARAEHVRVWPAAVVVDPVVRVADLCDLQGFPTDVEQALSDWIVTEAPPLGGTRIIHMDMVRDALAAGGVNMATIVFRGAVHCEVSRPAAPTPTPKKPTPLASAQKPRHQRASRQAEREVLPVGSAPTDGERTLRQFITDHFHQKLRRYGGTANVSFDRRNEQVLDLTDRDYAFEVQRRDGRPIGLTSLEVDVLADGEVVQKIDMVVQVTMNRRVVAARRSINQGATIRATDLHIIPTVVTRLDNTGLEDGAMAIGQRAKRFISIGSVLEPSMLEEVPLVKRGELVTVASAVGGVRVVTTGKAAQTGLLGDVIRIRSLSDRLSEFDAVITGPARVRVSRARPTTGVGEIAMRVAP